MGSFLKLGFLQQTQTVGMLGSSDFGPSPFRIQGHVAFGREGSGNGGLGFRV